MVLTKLNPVQGKKVIPLVRSFTTTQSKAGGAIAGGYQDGGTDFPYWLQPRYKIGKREVVGHGVNGQYIYTDRKDWPFPAIRWSEPTNESKALHEKEMGDWKKLTIEEKKALYRHSFCQTYAEIDAPTGEWKLAAAFVIFSLGFAFMGFYGLRVFIWPQRTLPSNTPEGEQKQLWAQLMLHNNNVEGIASKWNYETGKWKHEE